MKEQILKACESGGAEFQLVFNRALRSVVTRRRRGCSDDQAIFWMSVASEEQLREAYDDTVEFLGLLAEVSA